MWASLRDRMREMIDPAYIKILARYNRWQNESIFGAAAGLSDAQRREDRGAFFKSIHGTLNHLLFGDMMWMSRLSDLPRPAAAFPGCDFIGDWPRLEQERVALDAAILAWADRLTPANVAGDLVWRSAIQDAEVRKPRGLAIAHFFNHQTHHRGQVHAMLTAAGGKPLDTDLIFMTQMAS
jgi:uncharacterized damage-inducible protein DinB